MQEGIQSLSSRYSVEETVDRLRTLLDEKGIKFFCLIDHSGEAAAAGFQMRPTKLLIFGNPKAGTPLMLASPSAALDLPLKILVAEQSRRGPPLMEQCRMATGAAWFSGGDGTGHRWRRTAGKEGCGSIAAAIPRLTSGWHSVFISTFPCSLR